MTMRMTPEQEQRKRSLELRRLTKWEASVLKGWAHSHGWY
jgi:hypothetical protein